MQGRSQDYSYEARSEIQVARLLNNNAKKSDAWKSERVYQISVLNFHLPEHDNREMTWYTMRDKEGQVLSGHLNIIYIDLLVIKKLLGKPVKELTALQKWGLFLSYADDERYNKYIKQIADSDEGIMAADLIIGKMSEDDANWFRQNSIDIARRDRNTIIQNAEKRGLKKGIMEKAVEDAKRLLADGKYTADEISALLQIPVESFTDTVQKLANK